MRIARPLVVLLLSVGIALGGVLLARSAMVSAGQSAAPVIKPYDPYP